jgi:hypothetical protein
MHVYRTLVSVFVMVDRNEGWPLPNNDHVDRAPANTVPKVRNGPSGASVQHFDTHHGLLEFAILVQKG